MDGIPEARGRAWTDQDIRRFLKALRRPHRLKMLPLAQALCSAYAMSDPLEAAKRFVRETFPGPALHHRRMAELIARSDFDGTLPLNALAAELGVSPRQFFRYRGEAVRALREKASTLGAPFQSSHDIIVRIAGLIVGTDPTAAAEILRGSDALCPAAVDAAFDEGSDEEIELPRAGEDRLLVAARMARGYLVYGNRARAKDVMQQIDRELPSLFGENRRLILFEYRWIQFVDALFYARAEVAHAVACQLAQIAGDNPELLIRARFSLSEAALRIGDIESARRFADEAERMVPQTDARSLAVAVYFRGAIAFAEGRFAESEAFMSSVAVVLRHRRIDVWNTQSMIGRARRLLGRPWSLRAGSITPEPRHAPGRIDLAITMLRYRIGREDSATIERALRDELAAAREIAYEGGCASALAALGELALRDGDRTRAQALLNDARDAWSKTGDRSAVDLFAFCDGIVDATDHADPVAV